MFSCELGHDLSIDIRCVRSMLNDCNIYFKTNRQRPIRTINRYLRLSSNDELVYGLNIDNAFYTIMALKLERKKTKMKKPRLTSTETIYLQELINTFQFDERPFYIRSNGSNFEILNQKKELLISLPIQNLRFRIDKKMLENSFYSIEHLKYIKHIFNDDEKEIILNGYFKGGL